jgi:hypothetical protein
MTAICFDQPELQYTDRQQERSVLRHVVCALQKCSVQNSDRVKGELKIKELVPKSVYYQ